MIAGEENFNFPTWNSASEMFVNLNLLSFEELLGKSTDYFIKQITMISNIVNSFVPLVSTILKR